MTLRFRQESATGQLSLLPGGKMSLIRNRGALLEGRPSPKPGAPEQWTTLNLLDLGQRVPGSLPEVQAPGVDPFELITLLRGIDWKSDISEEWPVVVATSTGQQTEYQVTLSTKRLSHLLGNPDRAWVNALSDEKGGGRVTLQVTLDHGRIGSISGDLPIPAASLGPPVNKAQPVRAAGTGAIASDAVHATALIQFGYGRSSAGTGG
jgi:hypothetical protein